MTERLAALLRDEADALDVPAVDHAAILGLGQKTRSRRRTTTLLAAAVVVAVIGSGTALAVDRAHDPNLDAKATDSAAGSGPSRGLLAYGAFSSVTIEGTTATIPGSLHSLSYTSVGVLARSNAMDGASDGSGPETLTLVTADGTTTDLGTIPEGVGPATDPDESVYALAEKSGDGFRAVVRDALTGDEVGSVPLPDLPMSYWPVPPLALDGDVVYAGFETEAVAFNWRTGEAQPAGGVSGGIPEVRDGRTIVASEGSLAVVDAASGEPVLLRKHTESDYASGRLSPDGRYLLYLLEPMSGNGQEPEGLQVYNVDSGEHVQLPGPIYEWGWTSGSSTFRVTGKGLDVCSPATGACETESGAPLGANLRLAGNTYES